MPISLGYHHFILKNNKHEFKKDIGYQYHIKVREEIEGNWKIIEDDYFRLVEDITGYSWLHNQYRVVLTRTMLGVCNPFDSKTDEVAPSFNFPVLVISYIIAYELFHSHYLQIIGKKNNDRLFSTELNENCAVLVLLFSEVKNLFPFADDSMVQSCIASHKNAEKNFDDYLEKSFSVVSS